MQIEGNVTRELHIEKGVTINGNGKICHTKKCFAEIILQPEGINERNPPVCYRKNIPESWLRLNLTEGKNRQVRKMTAKVSFPTLRLIRYRIEKITTENFQLGEMKMLSHIELYNLLQIKKR